MSGWTLILLIPLLIDLCYTDIYYRRIRNHTTLFIAVLCVTGRYFSTEEIVWLPAAAVLLGGFLLNQLNVIGAGDIKLIAALALSFDGDATLLFLLLTALAGLPLIVFFLMIKFLLSRCCDKRINKNLPYGIAIVSGYLATLIILRTPA